jgi:hypothetical protein
MGAFSKLFAQDSSNSKLFPNFDAFLRKVQQREDDFPKKIATDVRHALFSEFDSFFKAEWERLLGVKLQRSRFESFGIMAASSLAQTLSRGRDVSIECVLLSSHEDVDAFGVAAPASTFQLILDSWLGFDVEKLFLETGVRREQLFSKQTTHLERVVLTTQTNRLSSLSPFGADANLCKTCCFAELNAVFPKQFEKSRVYWEQRTFEIVGNSFEWTLLFPISTLFYNEEAESYPVRVRKNRKDEGGGELDGEKCGSTTAYGDSRPGNFKGDNTRQTQEAADKNVVSGTINEVDEQGVRTVEVVVEIGSGETSLAHWNELQPGSILTTELPANKLFLALFDGQPAYYVKPGVYRNIPAFQIKSRIDN